MKYQLKNRSLCAVVDSLGGELISLTDDKGRERIWWGDPEVWSGHNPLLFPIVGRLHEDIVDINGRTYSMKQHGIARKREFALVSASEDAVEMGLDWDDDTLTQYPFRFSLRVRHSLEEDGFTTAITVTNCGDESMPYCVGAHTGFICPIEEGESFEEYVLLFPEDEDKVSIPVIPGAGLDPTGKGVTLHGRELPLKYDYFQQLDTVIFDGLESQSVRLVHKQSGHGVEMSFPGFPMLAFWTKPGANAPYLCIEPWHGSAWQKGETGKFADKPYCITLQPGESKTLSYTAKFI